MTTTRAATVPRHYDRLLTTRGARDGSQFEVYADASGKYRWSLRAAMGKRSPRAARASTAKATPSRRPKPSSQPPPQPRSPKPPTSKSLKGFKTRVRPAKRVIPEHESGF